MKRKTVTLDDALDTFRDLTATPADGAATRARVLARAAADARFQRTRAGRASFAMVGTVLVVCSSVAVAWTVSGAHWRAPATLTIATTESSLPSGRRSERPSRTIPPAGPTEAAAESSGEDAEQLSYAQAHRAHFFEDAPARALRLWDRYLKAHPGGRFVPEARFNRALCLIRLLRFDEATPALRSLANGPAGGYRQHDAAVLLEWMAAQRDGNRIASPASLP